MLLSILSALCFAAVIQIHRTPEVKYTFGQFHQHFTSSFFVRMTLEQLFCAYI